MHESGKGSCLLSRNGGRCHPCRKVRGCTCFFLPWGIMHPTHSHTISLHPLILTHALSVSVPVSVSLSVSLCLLCLSLSLSVSLCLSHLRLPVRVDPHPALLPLLLLFFLLSLSLSTNSHSLSHSESFYQQPTGPNPHNNRDDFSRPAWRHGSLNPLSLTFFVQCGRPPIQRFCLLLFSFSFTSHSLSTHTHCLTLSLHTHTGSLSLSQRESPLLTTYRSQSTQLSR